MSKLPVTIKQVAKGRWVGSHKRSSFEIEQLWNADGTPFFDVFHNGKFVKCCKTFASAQKTIREIASKSGG